MAGAIAVAAAAAAAALGANFGLFGLTQPHSAVGRLTDHRVAVTAEHADHTTTAQENDGRLDDD
jgi:hypothetical protein